MRHLEDVAGELEADMVKQGWTGTTVTLKYKLDTFKGEPLFAQRSGISFFPASQFLRDQSRLIVVSVQGRKTFLQ